MALKKLTLSVDERVIEKARRYSEDHRTSISRLVTGFLDSLPAGERRLSPVVERLLGVLPPDVDRSEYRRHLDDKYAK